MTNIEPGRGTERQDRRERLKGWGLGALDRLGSSLARSPIRTALCLSLTALSAPIWLTPNPPLVDYPNHLSRIYIMEHLAEDRFYQERFEIVSTPFPNMAMDLFMPVFTAVVGVEAAGKLFLNFSVLLFGLGCFLISKGLRGRASWPAVIAVFLVYNSNFFYGFTNYVFGLSLFLTVFGWRLTWRDRVTPLRAAALFPAALLAYFCHLTSFVFLAFSLGVHWLHQSYDRRDFDMKRAAWVFPSLAPPIVMYLLLNRHAEGAGSIAWGDITTKLITSFGWLFTYDYAADGLFAAWLIAAVLLVKRSGSFEIDRPACALAIAFWVAFAASPQVLHGSWAADARLVPPAAVFLVFAIRPAPPRRLSSILLAVTLAALLVRVAMVGRAWREGSDLIAEQFELFDLMAPRSTVYPMHWPSGDRQIDKRERGVEHAAAYAAIRRQAFVLNTFAIPGQHLLVFRDPSVQRSQRSVRQFSPRDWERAFTSEVDVDYVWAWRAPESARRELETRCALVASRGRGRLYRVRPRPEARLSQRRPLPG